MALSLAASAPASSRASFHRVALPAETAMLSVTRQSRFVTIVVDWEEFACREMKISVDPAAQDDEFSAPDTPLENAVSKSSFSIRTQSKTTLPCSSMELPTT
jgi:hypothetical protein